MKTEACTTYEKNSPRMGKRHNVFVPDSKRPPRKGAIEMDFGSGVVLRKVAGGNKRWVYANLREYDRLEHEAAIRASDGRMSPKPLDELTVWSDGKLLAYWATHIVPGDTFFSDRRAWTWLTTNEVEKQWRKFARWSRPVFKYLWSRESEQIEFIYEPAASEYSRCRNWMRRFFGAKELVDFSVAGVPHKLVMIRRPENV